MAANNTVLQRKLGIARSETGAVGKSALWALRRAVSKAADQVADLPLAVIGATQDRISHDALAERVGADSLPVLLDGPEGRRGALWLNRDAVAALVEHQTTGRISGKPAADRPFTATDAALSAPLVDAALAQAEALAEVAADRACLTGFRFGARAEDATTLVLAIEADRLRVFSLTLDFNGGAAQGTLLLALPEPETRPAQDPGAPASRQTLSDKACGGLRATLTAVICQMHLPLRDLASLAPGDLLELKENRLDETELVTIAGTCVATGQLGQSGGFRALRLYAGAPRDTRSTPAPSPDFKAVKPQGVPGKTATDVEAEAQLPSVLADVDELQLEAMPPELAAQEISELAGLPLDIDPWPETALEEASGAEKNSGT